MSSKKLFFLIIILAAVLRFYKLSEIPPGVNRDEASIGYTAYSLLETGKDEYGRFLPLSFQSFGDWKLPLYIYLTVPLVKIFGLSEFAVRFPSALAGVLTVIAVYYLVIELFGFTIHDSRFRNKKITNYKLQVTSYALLAAALLAISPWNIHLSRVESESNLAVLFISFATLLFLKAIRGKIYLLLPSAVLYALTYYTYHGNHIFSTLLLSGMLLIYNKAIPKTKTTFIGVLIFLIMVGFILTKTFASADKTKFAGISIFGDPAVVHTKIELPRNEHKNASNILSRLMHNRVIYALEKISQNYILGFSPEFLFIRGGTNRAHNIPNFGNMYLVEAPFLFLGLFYLFAPFASCRHAASTFLGSRSADPIAQKNCSDAATWQRRRKELDRYKKSYLLIMLWFFISPIAASITKDAPHTNRMFAIFPILPIVVAMGLVQFISLLRVNKLALKLGIGIVVLLFTFNFIIYLDRYYVHFPKTDAEYWGAGYKKLARLLENKKYRNKKIAIGKPETSPYIFLLFYMQFDPALYQKTAIRYPPTKDEFVHVKSFDRFEFRDLDSKTARFEIVEK